MVDYFFITWSLFRQSLKKAESEIFKEVFFIVRLHFFRNDCEVLRDYGQKIVKNYKLLFRFPATVNSTPNIVIGIF